MVQMDDARVGRIIREVRVRRGWRQQDLSAAAGMSQGVVSLIELGRLDRVSLKKLRAVGAVLDISVSLNAWWRAGDVDRLIDRGHAALVEYVVSELRAHGWVTRVEVTFNHFGDRGSADVVAWHPATRILLIVEVKTRIGDVQATVSTFERKVRILPGLLAAEEGWDPAAVGRVLVLADTTTARTLLRDHRATFGSVWPERTTATRRWVRRPDARPATDRAGFGGIWFVDFHRIGAPAARVRQVVRVRPAGRARGAGSGT